MTEEIKEILNKLKYIVDFPIIEHDTSFNPDNVEESVCLLISNECQLLLNYITNLQKSMEQTEIYKSRCKKVNKLITDFMCTEEYCNVDPIAIAENYMKIQKALIGSDENE